MSITSTLAEFVYCENDEDNTYLNLFPNCQIRIPKNSSWNTPIYLGDAVLPFCNISIIIDDQEYYPININNSIVAITENPPTNIHSTTQEISVTPLKITNPAHLQEGINQLSIRHL
jgi:hypothetical protein